MNHLKFCHFVQFCPFLPVPWTFYKKMDKITTLGNRHNKGRPRETGNPSFEQNVLNITRKNTSTSVRAVVVTVEGSRSSVHRILQREEVTPIPDLQRTVTAPHKQSCTCAFLHGSISTNIAKKLTSDPTSYLRLVE